MSKMIKSVLSVLMMSGILLLPSIGSAGTYEGATATHTGFEKPSDEWIYEPEDH